MLPSAAPSRPGVCFGDVYPDCWTSIKSCWKDSLLRLTKGLHMAGGNQVHQMWSPNVIQVQPCSNRMEVGRANFQDKQEQGKALAFMFCMGAPSQRQEHWLHCWRLNPGLDDWSHKAVLMGRNSVLYLELADFICYNPCCCLRFSSNADIPETLQFLSVGVSGCAILSWARLVQQLVTIALSNVFDAWHDSDTVTDSISSVRLELPAAKPPPGNSLIYHLTVWTLSVC